MPSRAVGRSEAGMSNLVNEILLRLAKAGIAALLASWST